MQSPEEEILAALTHYRDSVLQHNHTAFQHFVQHVEAAALSAEKASISPNRISEVCQEYFYNLLYVSRPERLDPSLQIHVPADVMTKWDALARAFALDGVHIGSDANRREQFRRDYKNGIETELRKIDPELKFPADFEVLMSQVDSLEGHGWPQYRAEGQQVRFWDGLGEDEGGAACRVFGPDDKLAKQFGLEDWETKAGWQCGMGPETTCFAAYCRQDETGKEWAWRYVADQGQYGVETFDNVVELLRWYETLYIPPLDYYIGTLDIRMGQIFKE
ncbi:hypothetical protein F5Y00DRAFT_272510 [Daldinia vernicosa]|uniref:uncharacterized protein n=1 Tax=Daldinia vernicosa TaxID=114800 RepID=UPI0020079E4D|nr:uncharacterized protein F5Y00DRAFT_272510 [Daldinia vernicosa]KAI0852920.1 hypothetical protein F5Y00DRAFT_272510 [Daldinia vernicosa]